MNEMSSNRDDSNANKETAHASRNSGLQLRHRLVAAGAASILATLVTSPLDTIKTRMQSAHAQVDGAGSAADIACQRYPVRSVQRLAASRSSLLHETIMRGWHPAPQPANLTFCVCTAGPSPALHLQQSSPISLAAPWMQHCSAAMPKTVQRPAGTMTTTFQSLVEQEGLRGLWRGLDTALLMALPTVLLYYPLYDALMPHLASTSFGLGPAAPMLAGACARAATVVAVAPLELVRTRQQAAGLTATPNSSSSGSSSSSQSAGRRRLHPSHPATASTFGVLRSSLGLEQPGRPGALGLGQVVRALPRLWTGLSATLARDVPFAAIYWGLMEPIRGALLRPADMDPSPWPLPPSASTPGHVSSFLPSSQASPAAHYPAPACLNTDHSAHPPPHYAPAAARDHNPEAVKQPYTIDNNTTALSQPISHAQTAMDTQATPFQPASAVSPSCSISRAATSQPSDPSMYKPSSQPAWPVSSLHVAPHSLYLPDSQLPQPASQPHLHQAIETQPTAPAPSPLPCQATHLHVHQQQHYCEPEWLAPILVDDLPSPRLGPRKFASDVLPQNAALAFGSSNCLAAVASSSSRPNSSSSSSQLVFSNLVAGSLAGATAAAVTTPFDVIKTRMQTHAPTATTTCSRPPRLTAVLEQVWRQQGVRGLFVGVGPRAARCAPACAIVVACYEGLKACMA